MKTELKNKNTIFFHNEKVLLSPQGIFWNPSEWHFSEIIIARKMNLNSIELVELHTHDFPCSESRWVTLREALQYVSQEDFYWLSKGFSILRWDKHHQFCGGCSKKTSLHQDSFERYCSICQIKYYPRISPAIIVLIRRGADILMARSAHFSPGVYGLIAGFVEAGESLEEAVHREVFEEVGIRINNLSYYGSQPWPFPDSLMVGFFADYVSGEISIDRKELEEAGWYPCNHLPGLPSSQFSIAFQMIKHMQKKPK
jgi:NAD+ diphosphatase